MEQFSFEATGTQWTILIDQLVDRFVLDAVKECAVEFEERFSRFKVTSEIGEINSKIQTFQDQNYSIRENGHSEPFDDSHTREESRHELSQDSSQVSRSETVQNDEHFVISSELAEMLVFGKELQGVTDGYFDLNVASILEGYGYDSKYSFQKDEKLLHQRMGEWSIDRSKVKGQKSKLSINGLVKLDLGAFGKGRLIDNIAGLLDSYMVQHYLVDGGRDFYGTTKADGSAWMIALEHPFDAGMAIGEFALKNCALACSGISQRKVKEFHHFMDTKTRMPVAEPVGVFVAAESAMVADGVSTAMAVSSEDYIYALHKKYGVSYCVVYRSGEIIEKDFSNYLYT